jgi:hypothetical protein
MYRYTGDAVHTFICRLTIDRISKILKVRDRYRLGSFSGEMTMNRKQRRAAARQARKHNKEWFPGITNQELYFAQLMARMLKPGGVGALVGQDQRTSIHFTADENANPKISVRRRHDV